MNGWLLIDFTINKVPPMSDYLGLELANELHMGCYPVLPLAPGGWFWLPKEHRGAPVCTVTPLRGPCRAVLPLKTFSFLPTASIRPLLPALAARYPVKPDGARPVEWALSRQDSAGLPGRFRRVFGKPRAAGWLSGALDWAPHNSERDRVGQPPRTLAPRERLGWPTPFS